MIIAIMGESNAKAREGAYNIALCERAKVILIWERNFLKRQRSKFRRVLKRCLPRCLQWKEQKPFPRWLHVLRPAEHSRDGQEEREEVTLDSIREQMEQLTSTMNEKVETLSKKMDNSLAMAKATSEVLTFGAQKPTRNL